MSLLSFVGLCALSTLLLLMLGNVIGAEYGFGQITNSSSNKHTQMPSFLPSFSLFESEKVILVSHRIFDEGNVLHIEGEVKNNSTELLQKVQVNASFYGSNNLLQYFKDDYTNPEILTPKMSATFEISIDKDETSEAKGYRLELSWQDMNFDKKIAKMLDITNE